jgi:hypothetical protein
MRLLLLVLLGLSLAAFTYLVLERMGRRGLVPLALRGIAWSSLFILLADLTCSTRPVAPGRPLVLLDRSLSMLAAGARGTEASDSARAWGDLRYFGDDRPGTDSSYRGRSLIAPSLAAALAAARPVVVVTDGELDDISEVPADLLAQTELRLFARSKRADVAVSGVTGPAHATAGDTVQLEIEIRAGGGWTGDSVRLEVSDEGRVLGRRRVPVHDGGVSRVVLGVPTAKLAAGDHLLRVGLAAPADDEPRDDARLHFIAVAQTPGIVLLAAPPDWDSRTLFEVLGQVAGLPLRGYLMMVPGQWRSMQDLSLVPAAQVRQAAERADLLILKGAPGDVAGPGRNPGILRWPSGEAHAPVAEGDWYFSVVDGSPISGSLLGSPVDSFPPAARLGASTITSPGDWVALTAELGRRGPARPVVYGRSDGRRREVVVAADGLWRWAFRGGSSEAAYRSLQAAIVSWLLAGGDSTAVAARPRQAVAEQGRPVTFTWSRPGTPRPLAVTLSTPAGSASDTLRFDGRGEARLYLPPGRYHYRLAGGGEGTVAVEEYSSEFFPRPAAVSAHGAIRPVAMDRGHARRLVWLFLLTVAALCGEWYARKRLGLR